MSPNRNVAELKSRRIILLYRIFFHDEKVQLDDLKLTYGLVFGGLLSRFIMVSFSSIALKNESASWDYQKNSFGDVGVVGVVIVDVDVVENL